MDRHTHRTSGQVLTHAHPGGDREHQYFEHHEDGVHITCDHDDDWAGTGYSSPLRQALRAELARRSGQMATLAELEIFHLGTERRVLIAELARMRDDGEVKFVGPRYKLL